MDHVKYRLVTKPLRVSSSLFELFFMKNNTISNKMEIIEVADLVVERIADAIITCLTEFRFMKELVNTPLVSISSIVAITVNILLQIIGSK